MVHCEAFQVNKYDHAGDDELLILVTQNLRDHETYSLNLFKLFGFNRSLVIIELKIIQCVYYKKTLNIFGSMAPIRPNITLRPK